MIKIYTFAHKRPDFLDLQLKSFHKNIEDKFEFIVYNNASFDSNKNLYNEIKKFCDDNHIEHRDIQRDRDLIEHIRSYNGEWIFNGDGTYFNATIACAYPLCYAWKNDICKTNDLTCIIDSDMFFVERENITRALQQYDIIYQPQSRGPNGEVYYMWNGLVYINMEKLPDKESLDWWCGYCEGYPVDVGGHTFYYLKKHEKDIKTVSLNQHYIGEDPACNFSPANYEYFAINDVKTVLHYRGGSNWDHKTPDYHFKKTQWLKTKLNT